MFFFFHSFKLLFSSVCIHFSHHGPASLATPELNISAREKKFYRKRLSSCLEIIIVMPFCSGERREKNDYDSLWVFSPMFTFTHIVNHHDCVWGIKCLMMWEGRDGNIETHQWDESERVKFHFFSSCSLRNLKHFELKLFKIRGLRNICCKFEIN
jgi:hypothetical protein